MEYNEILLVLAILSVAATVAPRASMAQGEAEHHHHHHAIAQPGYTLTIASYQTPDVSLVDAYGKEVALSDSLDGAGPVMLNFIFTTCSAICPVMSATFSQAQAKLGTNRDKVRMVSISIDPEHDTPPRLKEYAERFEAGPQWSMLTGTMENSIAVQRAFDVYRGDKMNHEPVTFMRKGPGLPWVRINGFISADDLLREYDRLASN